MFHLLVGNIDSPTSITYTREFFNQNDENMPLVRVLPAGKGRELANRSRLQPGGLFSNQTFIILIILLIISVVQYYRYKAKIFPYDEPVIYAAAILSTVALFGLLVLGMNLGGRVREKQKTPKVIVDNYNKKTAPFFDATGAHAGALLGDVLHDPFRAAD